jgi:nicotinamidase-related amidase
MGDALVLIDMQEALCRPDGMIGEPSGIGAESERRGILEAARRGLDAARQANLTVAHVMVGHDEGATLKTTRTPGSEGIAQVLQLGRPQTRICPEVAPLDSEPVIVKTAVDPFVGTPLDILLRNRGVTTLYLGGVTTNHAVESGARTASDLGYEVFVVEDMCASMSEEMHAFSIEQILPVFGAALSESEFLGRVRSADT